MQVDDDTYTLQSSNGVIAYPPNVNERVNPALYPIPYANEPYPGKNANAFLAEWTLDSTQVKDVPRNNEEEIV